MFNYFEKCSGEDTLEDTSLYGRRFLEEKKREEREGIMREREKSNNVRMFHVNR